MTQVQIGIQNLKCGGCATTIQNKLKELPGVFNVAVDEENSIVTCDVDEELQMDTITTELDRLGYPPEGDENTFGKKAKSYVSCMIGRIS